MNVRAWFRPTTCCVALAFGVVALAGRYARQSDQPLDLVRNGGFEAGGALPSDWFFDASLSDKGTVALIANPVHAGKSALRLAPTDRNTEPNKPLSIGQLVSAEEFRGNKLLVSAWLGARGNSKAVFGMIAMDRGGKAVASSLLQQDEDGGVLRYHEDVLSVPDSPEVDRLIIVCADSGTGGEAIFDDVSATVGLPARYSYLAANPGPALPVQVSVDADQVVRAIPRTLYGVNTEWIWNCQGMWDVEKGAFREDVLAMTKSLEPSLLRFPGGVFSDFYHWRDGIGPGSSRPSTVPTPGDSPSRHVVGTDEMLDFVGRIGAQLLLTVNAGTGTAQEAADWVRYVKGKPGVAIWEIGNEVYLDDGSPASKVISMTPAKYADRCAEFIKAMRAVDPKAKIAAIGDESYWNPNVKQWDKTVLAKVGAEIDYFAIHSAYAPMALDDRGRGVREIYAGLLAAPVLIQKSLDKVVSQIRGLPPKDAGRIKIAVTEWGTLFHIFPSSRYVDHCKTLGSAIYDASVMRAFLVCPQVEVANFFKLVDPLFIGAIGKRGNVHAEAAPYYALQLFTKHFGALLVRSTSTSPTFTSLQVGFTPPVADAPYFEVVSSLSQDGKTLYLIGINKHFDRAMQAKITVRGFEPSGGGTAWTLTGTGIDANTGTAPAKVPGADWVKQAEAEPNPRFAKGAPGEVTLTGSPLTGMGREAVYTFPAHSVVCLEILRK